MESSTSKNIVPITIFRGFVLPGKFVWSPFVTKLEFRLRLGELKYKSDAGSPLSAPRGKLPYVTIGENDTISDSTLIIRDLIQNGILLDINESLTPSERGIDVAVRAMMEDKLYFYNVRERWVDNYYTMRDHALVAIPYPMRVVVGIMAYRRVMSYQHSQGIGRFSKEEIAYFKQEIWQGINDILAESKTKSNGKGPFWILGKADPTEADATVFGLICSTLICDAAPESKKIVGSFPVIVEYANRIHERYFPDYARWE